MQHQLDTAATFLREGKLVAFPTETVYGLGANALSDQAVAAIYAAKGRPEFNPLIVHVASADDAKNYVQWNDTAELLANHFWPGPLTLVLPRKKDCAISLLASAGLDTLAIRVPAHPLALALLAKTQLPIAAPSANRSGRVSPTLASHVAEELGDKLAMILDGGPCQAGIESTILDLTAAPAILRHGHITSEQLEKLISLSHQKIKTIKAPGMLESHYAPESPLRLNATFIHQGESLLAFGTALPGAAHIENLSETENLEEAAANLFRLLRNLDAGHPPAIAAMPIPMYGLGMAINDRLSRAAARK